MKGSKINITENPRGRQLEGIVSGTPKPGTLMQILAGTAMDGNGRHTWEAYNRDADGDNPAGPLAVLLERGEGYTYATAYVDGDPCFLYCPLPGDELNVLWATSGTGAADALTVGQIGMPEDGTGYIIDTTGVECEPVIAMEALDDTVADGTLTWVMFSN